MSKLSRQRRDDVSAADLLKWKREFSQFPLTTSPLCDSTISAVAIPEESGGIKSG